MPYDIKTLSSGPLPLWSDDPRVAPILQSVRLYPPKVKLYVDPLFSEWRCGLIADKPAYDEADERVEALACICNEYFVSLDPLDAIDPALYLERAREFMDQPSPSDLIDMTQGRGVLAPSLPPRKGQLKPIPRGAAKVREAA